MKNKTLWWLLGGLGMLFILSSLVITIVEYNRFTQLPVVFPPGSRIAEVLVCGLDETGAEDRLTTFFSLPLEIDINGARIHTSPESLDFSIDPAGLVQQATGQLLTGRFWDYLWGRSVSTPVVVPFSAAVNESQILSYLNREIVPRYTQPGNPMMPTPLTTNFSLPEPAERLDLEEAVSAINTALLSPSTHRVTLRTFEQAHESPDWDLLESFLVHNITWLGFNDLVEVYIESKETGQALLFAIRGGELVEPNVAFTAASTIKIPIMISVLRRTDEPIPQEIVTLFEQMIVQSENPPADTLMSTYLDEVRGPLIVTEDLAALGMENTFLAGYFYLGAPLLQRFETPANTRRDIFLSPDIYNQTTAAEAGQLLSAIYDCAQDGSGLLTETFPGEFTQSKCQLMIDTLAANKIGLLIQAGLPPDAIAAHKHGWVRELDGQLRSMSDVAIVFTPGGDYILNVFTYDTVRLDFDIGNQLIARLSQTVYNFFNVDNQTYWRAE